jgi:site-specific recombinase XerD
MNQLIVANNNTERLVALITNGKAANTQEAYRAAVVDFQTWTTLDGRGFTRESVLAYVEHLKAQGLANSTINQRLTALRMLAREIRFVPGASPGDRATAEGIIAVENLARRGRKLGHWLSNEQVKSVMALPNLNTLKGKQERAVIALLLGAGLRREEAATVTFAQVQQREDVWLIVDLDGKGDKTRSVHLSPWVVEAVQEWQDAAGLTEGKILRAVNKADRLTGPMRTKGGGMSDGGMSAQAVYNVVKDLARGIDLPELGPHSLRRTWARRAYDMGFPLDQISLTLGHASLRTTEIYLGLNSLDLENPVHVSF